LIHVRFKRLLEPTPTVGHPKPNVRYITGAARSMGVEWPKHEADCSAHPVSRIRLNGTLPQHNIRIHDLHRPDFTRSLFSYKRKVFKLVSFLGHGIPN